MYDEERRIRNLCREAGMDDEKIEQVVEAAQDWAARRYDDGMANERESRVEPWSE